MSVPSVAVAASPSTASQGFSAEALISLRAAMLRFAQLQLRNSEAAEDKRNRIVDHLPLTGRAPQSSGYQAQFFGLLRLTVDVA